MTAVNCTFKSTLTYLLTPFPPFMPFLLSKTAEMFKFNQSQLRNGIISTKLKLKRCKK